MKAIQVHNKDTRAKSEQSRSGVFIVNFEQVLHFFLVFPLLIAGKNDFSELLSLKNILKECQNCGHL